MTLAAITIDVDSIGCYRAIHGLPAAPLDEDPIYTIAMPRFFSILAEAKVPATLFLIGADAPAHAAVFEPVKATGSEIASHSFSHDYALSRRSPEVIAEDLEAADRALAPLSPDGRIAGFRAPGYNTSAALLEAVHRLGYRYDSSMLPAPLYFAARAVAIAGYRLRGRRSSSMVGKAAAFAGPRRPYRTTAATPWRPTRDGPILELPMAVDPRTRTPLIGTALTTFPPFVFDRMVDSALRRSSFFNFEMHAIDLLDHADPGVDPELVRAQGDLRVSSAVKVDRLRRLVQTLVRRADVQTLRDHAKHVESDV